MVDLKTLFLSTEFYKNESSKLIKQFRASSDQKERLYLSKKLIEIKSRILIEIREIDKILETLDPEEGKESWQE